MALAEVLSAVRELILDERAYPELEADRLRYLGERYPRLSQEEREDLAKITPDRLKLYTVSIFAGERNVLRSKFPITFALLDRLHAKRGEELDGYELARSLHEARPWRTAQITELVSNFAAFLRDERRHYLDAEPRLGDVLYMEELSFGVPRAENDLILPANSMQLSEAEDRSVDEILSLQGFIPHYVRQAVFSFDCTDLFYYFRRNQELPEPFEPERKKAFGIVSRTAEYATRWSTVSPEMYAALAGKLPSVLFELSQLAELFLVHSPEGRPEEESASLFLRDLNVLNENGAILIID